MFMTLRSRHLALRQWLAQLDSPTVRDCLRSRDRVVSRVHAVSQRLPVSFAMATDMSPTDSFDSTRAPTWLQNYSHPRLLGFYQHCRVCPMTGDGPVGHYGTTLIRELRLRLSWGGGNSTTSSANLTPGITSRSNTYRKGAICTLNTNCNCSHCRIC